MPSLKTEWSVVVQTSTLQSFKGSSRVMATPLSIGLHRLIKSGRCLPIVTYKDISERIICKNKSCNIDDLDPFLFVAHLILQRQELTRPQPKKNGLWCAYANQSKK